MPRCGLRLGIFPVLLASLLGLGPMQAVASAEEAAILPASAVSASPVPEYPVSAPGPSAVDGANNDMANPVELTVPLAEPQMDSVSKRLFGIIPDYQADQKTAVYKPLTTPEKYRIALDNSFDWPNFPLLVAYTLQGQIAADGFHQRAFMQEFGAYYARGFGDQVIGSYVTEAILPAAFHEDPRYFRIGTGSVLHRIGYAASRIFVTKGDNGKDRFYTSEIIGNIGVVAVTSLYYTQSQTANQGALRYGMQLGNDVLTNILTEFWPDIRHRLRFLQHYFPPR